MKHWQSAIIGIIALLTWSCVPITWDCGGPESRGASAVGTVADTGDTIRVEAWVAMWEKRGSEVSRQLAVTVQSVRGSNYPPPAPATLVGHVKFARLERSDGTVLYRYALTPAARDEPSLVGIAVDNGLTPWGFQAMRELLVTNEVFVTLETDVPDRPMRRAALVVGLAGDWHQRGCQ